MINKLRAWYAARRRKRYVGKMREAYAALGYDLSHVSDSEVAIEGNRLLTADIKEIGATCEEASRGLQAFAYAYNESALIAP